METKNRLSTTREATRGLASSPNCRRPHAHDAVGGAQDARERSVPIEMANKKGMTRAAISCTRKNILSHRGALPRVEAKRDVEATEVDRRVAWRLAE